ALAGRVRDLVALADDDDREILALRVTAADVLARLLDGDRMLGDENHVGAAGDAAHHRDPAGVTTHHLDDHDAVVRLRGRVQSVDRLGRDEHCGVEAERVVRRGEVVVDRLRDADDAEVVLLVQPRSDAERVLTADRDEGVELGRLERSQYSLDAAVELERVRARGADDRAAPRWETRWL